MSADRNESKGNGARLPQLDALRGLAALWVIFFHWTVRYDELYGHAESLPLRIPDGRHGVHLFFMISGFVILMTLDKVESIRDFIVFRFTRLYPTFWACAATSFLVILFFGLPGREVSLTDALVNITMIPYVLRFKFIDSVYWSLEVELFFYALMAGIVAIGARRYLVHILTALVLLNIAFLALPGTVVQLPGFVKLLRLLLSMRYINLFLFGILCYEMTRAPRRWYYPLMLLCLCVPASDLISWTFFAPPGADLIAGEDVLFVFVMGALFWVGTQCEVRFLRLRPLLFLGFISYPLYLLHQNIGFVIMRESYRLGLSVLAVLVIPALIVIPLATFISVTVEHPVNRALRTWYKKRIGSPHAQS